MCPSFTDLSYLMIYICATMCHNVAHERRLPNSRWHESLAILLHLPDAQIRILVISKCFLALEFYEPQI